MTDVQKAPRDLGKTAFILWVVSIGIPVLAFLAGVALSFGGGSGMAAALTPASLPIYTSILWIPAAIAALVVGIVALRRPGAPKALAIATVALSGIGVLPVVIGIAFLLLSVLRSV